MTLSTIAILAVGVVELAFGAIELFCPKTALSLALRGYDPPDTEDGRNVILVTKNMGLYNIFLGLGLILVVAKVIDHQTTALYLVSCVSVAGIVAGCMVGWPWPRAFIAQFALGLVAAVVLLMAGKPV